MAEYPPDNDLTDLATTLRSSLDSTQFQLSKLMAILRRQLASDAIKIPLPEAKKEAIIKLIEALGTIEAEFIKLKVAIDTVLGPFLK